MRKPWHLWVSKWKLEQLRGVKESTCSRTKKVVDSVSTSGSTCREQRTSHCYAHPGHTRIARQAPTRKKNPHKDLPQKRSPVAAAANAAAQKLQPQWPFQARQLTKCIAPIRWRKPFAVNHALWIKEALFKELLQSARVFPRSEVWGLQTCSGWIQYSVWNIFLQLLGSEASQFRKSNRCHRDVHFRVRACNAMPNDSISFLVHGMCTSQASRN